MFKKEFSATNVCDYHRIILQSLSYTVETQKIAALLTTPQIAQSPYKTKSSLMTGVDRGYLHLDTMPRCSKMFSRT